MCGSKVPGDKFYVHMKLFHGDYIESQYYNHLGGKKAKNGCKGGRSLIRNMCTICYLFQDYLLDAEINGIRNIRGKSTLLIYAVFASIVILKFRPRADPVTHKKIRDKEGQQIKAN